MTRLGRRSLGQGAHLYRQPRVLPRRLAYLGAVVLLAVVALVIVQLVRKVPRARLDLTVASVLTVPGHPPSLSWPAADEGVMAVEGAGTIASFGSQIEVPIASVTKMMTALVVLQDHPLAVDASGPTITVTANDLASYQQERAAGDSVVPVALGERLSELQALEGLLIPSGDNLAVLLARWDAGTRTAFVTKMNAVAHRLGLAHTHYAGVSGVDPATVSTAQDQLRLARRCLRDPAFAAIVAMPQVILPVAGIQYNVNGDLGRAGIVGVKTGWIPQAGADLVVAARRPVHGRHATVVGAILGEQGASPLPSILAAAKRLVVQAGDALATHLLLRPGQVVARLRSPYGPAVPVVTTGAVRLLAWPGAHVTLSARPTRRTSGFLRSGTRIGTLVLTLGREQARVPLALGRSLGAPSLLWRLTRA